MYLIHLLAHLVIRSFAYLFAGSCAYLHQTCPGSPGADFGQIVYSSSTGFDHRRAQEAQLQILVKYDNTRRREYEQTRIREDENTRVQEYANTRRREYENMRIRKNEKRRIREDENPIREDTRRREKRTREERRREYENMSI